MQTLKILFGAGLILFGVLELNASPDNAVIAIILMAIGVIALLTSVNFKSTTKGDGWISGSHSSWSDSGGSDCGGGGE